MEKKDQAYQLRSLKKRIAGGIKTYTIASGKGGVGKTSLSVNLALTLGKMGVRTIILDGDLGLANVDVMFGLYPKYHLGYVIKGDKKLSDILVSVQENVYILPGGTGLQEMADLDAKRQLKLIEELASLEEYCDVLLIDTGAGVHRSVVVFAIASDSLLLVTSPDPTAIRDCYGLLKAVSVKSSVPSELHLVINMVKSDKEAMEVASRLQLTAKDFLGIDINMAGYILKDFHVEEAVKMGMPFVISHPDCEASKCVAWIAKNIFNPEGVDSVLNAPSGRGIKAFCMRLLKQFQLR